MSMNGDYQSLAEACGEAPRRPLAYVAGVDFDADDPDEWGAVLLATARDQDERERAEVRQLRHRNAALLDALREADPDAAEQFED